MMRNLEWSRDYYHFVRIHSSLSLGDHLPKRKRQRTPAFSFSYIWGVPQLCLLLHYCQSPVVPLYLRDCIKKTKIGCGEGYEPGLVPVKWHGLMGNLFKWTAVLLS